MATVEEALALLSAVGIPLGEMTARRQKRIALALFAIANMRPKTPWKNAAIWGGEGSHQLTTRQIIEFWNQHWDEHVSSGSYDDVRRRDLIYLVESGIAQKSAGNPGASTNNPTRGYAVDPLAKDLLQRYGEAGWPQIAEDFVGKVGSLEDRLRRPRAQSMIPVVLPSGVALELSIGAHNELQKAIIEHFLPRFVPGAIVLYVGDTTNKSLFVDEHTLRRLGFFELAHDALPDIVAYDEKRNWLVLVEAVHSANPISPLRHVMLERMTANCAAPRVYVSAFRSRQAFREWILEISWETEVWLADTPDHLIHFNGDKFLGPHA